MIRARMWSLVDLLYVILDGSHRILPVHGLARLHSESLHLSEIFHHGQRRRVAWGLGVRRSDHQIREFGLTLVEEGLEVRSLGFVIGRFDLEAIYARNMLLLCCSRCRMVSSRTGETIQGSGLLTFELLLDLDGASSMLRVRSLHGVGTFQLASLVLDLALEDGDVFPQGLLRGISSPSLALEVGYPALHLLLLDLPGVPVALVSMPFGLQEAHDALEGVLGGLGLVRAMALHCRAHIHPRHAVAAIGAHHSAPNSGGRGHRRGILDQNREGEELPGSIWTGRRGRGGKRACRRADAVASRVGREKKGDIRSRWGDAECTKVRLADRNLDRP